MNPMLNEEDSARVADALIEKINDSDFDIAGAVKRAVEDFLYPKGVYNWEKDWLPLLFEDELQKIRSGIVEAAYQAARK